MLYSGSLNVYFPCKLKEKGVLKDIFNCSNRLRARQRRIISVQNMPMSNLTDLKRFRDRNERVISRYCLRQFNDFVYNPDLLPFALPCLGKTYRHSVGDNVYVKVANVLLSRFNVDYDFLPNKTIVGILLCNVNIDNSVATYTIVLNFKNFTAEEVILLKHLFYKRALVKISEYPIKLVSSHCSLKHSECCKYQCVETESVLKVYNMSFQDFVIKKQPYKKSDIELKIDTKARFSLLELDKWMCQYECNAEIRGLLKADDGYLYNPKHENELKSISHRISYDHYLSGTNGLILVSRSFHSKYVQQCNAFIDKLTTLDNHVKREKRVDNACVAGVDVNQFPSYMRAVELHYLISTVLTNDIIPREQSYFNPYVFIGRGYRLWKIIYELDIHRYHRFKELFDSFGINKNMEQIKDEYRMILTHGVSYFALLISLMTFVITLLLEIFKVI